MTTKELQKALGVTVDGAFGPKTEAAFLAAFVNTNAPAINSHDMLAAASRLNVPLANLKALAEKESGRASFSTAGRPVILFEAHWFSRLTKRVYDRTHPSISSRRWNRRLYARHMPGRYKRLARAARLNVDAALSSASWGKFQIMGFHWERLGYESPWDFAMQMVQSEGNHLDALVRFIEANNLAGALRACKAGSPQSCEAFAKGYNGSGFRKNSYHIKLSKLIGKHS